MYAPVIINIQYFASAATCASKDKYRPYLNGVLVEVLEGQTKFTATDGLHLVNISDATYPANEWDPPEDYDFEPYKVIVPAGMAKKLADLVIKSKKGDEGLFSNHVKMTRMENGDLVFTTLAGSDLSNVKEIICQEIKAEYPDYAKVIPSLDRLTKGTPGEVISFSWYLCASIESAFSTYLRGNTGAFRSIDMNYGGSSEPALFHNADFGFIGVVMPRRSDRNKPTEDAPVSEELAGIIKEEEPIDDEIVDEETGEITNA